MDDRLRETLSAMLDDQADELSVRRLLSHSSQTEIREQWQRWQMVRDLMHEVGTDGEMVDVSDQVRSSLAGAVIEPQVPVAGPAPAVRSRNWHWTAVAMVFAGVLVGFGMGSSWGPFTETDYVPVMAAQPPASATGSVPEVALQGLDDEQWEHLSRYLLEHAQHNSVAAGRGAVGYARLASVSAPAY